MIANGMLTDKTTATFNGGAAGGGEGGKGGGEGPVKLPQKRLGSVTNSASGAAEFPDGSAHRARGARMHAAKRTAPNQPPFPLLMSCF